MAWQEYIQPELLVLIPVLYAIGYALKKSAIRDRFIPFILGAVGVVLATLYILSVNRLSGAQNVMQAVFCAITQGILCAAASVYVNQSFKQLSAGKDEAEQ